MARKPPRAMRIARQIKEATDLADRYPDYIPTRRAILGAFDSPYS